MPKIITITSGKGGVGKTNIGVNLALGLGKNHRVCLFDADLGLANTNILLGLYPRYTLEDVVAGDVGLEEIIVRDIGGIDIIPGSSGVERIATIGGEELVRMIGAFSLLPRYDYVVVDTSAGIAGEVISFSMAASFLVVVITGEPTSLTDAYALVKLLSRKGWRGTVSIVVNMCATPRLSGLVYAKFKEVVEKFLPLTVDRLGTLPLDPCVTEAVKSQEPFSTRFPDSPAAAGMESMVERLRAMEGEGMGFDGFWMKFLRHFRGGAPQADPGPSQAEPRRPEMDRGPQAAPRRPEAPADAGGSDAQILSMLDVISEKIDGLSREVAAIREAVKRGRGGAAAEPAMISLDFEAYKRSILRGR